MREVSSPEIGPSDRQLLKGFEGGAVYTADLDGKFYVIMDEGTMAHFLDEDDLAGLQLTKALEFDSEAERQAYIVKRGWTERGR